MQGFIFISKDDVVSWGKGNSSASFCSEDGLYKMAPLDSSTFSSSKSLILDLFESLF